MAGHGQFRQRSVLSSQVYLAAYSKQQDIGIPVGKSLWFDGATRLGHFEFQQRAASCAPVHHLSCFGGYWPHSTNHTSTRDKCVYGRGELERGL